MDIYETHNSRYEVDLINLKYRRTPLDPDRADDAEKSPRLVVGEWHPLQDIPEPVKVIPDPYSFDSPAERPKVLFLMHETSTLGIVTSPITWMCLGADCG